MVHHPGNQPRLNAYLGPIACGGYVRQRAPDSMAKGSISTCASNT